MTAGAPRFGMARAFAATGVAVIGLLAACGTPLPNVAEIEALDVEPMDDRTTNIAADQDRTEPIYIVDGVVVEPQAARGLGPERIRSIEIIRGRAAAEELGTQSEIVIIRGRTADAEAEQSSAPRAEAAVATAAEDQPGLLGVTTDSLRGGTPTTAAQRSGSINIDGRLTTADQIIRRARPQIFVDGVQLPDSIIATRDSARSTALRPLSASAIGRSDTIISIGLVPNRARGSDTIVSIGLVPNRESGTARPSRAPVGAERAIRIEDLAQSNRLVLEAGGSNGHPLVIVDGVILQDSERLEIRSEEIESIEVIKGPAAERLYGSRAAAGVILVTTKQEQR